MSEDQNPIVGHKTFSDGRGGFRHEPLRQIEAEAIMESVREADRIRAERMPDTLRKALQAQARRIDDTDCILSWRPWYVGA